MPHYKNGTPAKEGDLVIGKPYNTPTHVIGIVVSVSPSETCNCRVQMLVGLTRNEAGSVTSAFPMQGSDYGEVAAFSKID